MNAQNVKQLMPILQAFAEGKQIQLRCGFNWMDCDDFDFKCAPSDYRIKPTLTLRPWRPEEVPVGAIVSCGSKHTNRFVITGIWNGELHLNGAPCAATHERSPLLKCLVGPEYHYSLDHGKTWLPCGVPVE